MTTDQVGVPGLLRRSRSDQPNSAVNTRLVDPRLPELPQRDPRLERAG